MRNDHKLWPMCWQLLLLIGLVTGCDTKSPESSSPNGTAPTKPNQFSDNFDGPAILSRTCTEYAAATSYSDRAMLYLNYRLQGRPIQEPHPFATIWQRPNLFAARIFNAQIQCDGNLLSCFVFDNDTANLDGQYLFLPANGNVPIEDLYRDGIVRHFVGGYAEMPLDETEKNLPPSLIPPPISLLIRQTQFGWLQGPERAERQPDQTVDQRLCYVVRSLFSGATADIWIDQQTKLLVQISLPLKLMARPVLTSGEIENVELMIRFHDAQINQPIASETFSVPTRTDATPVRQFVSIPAAFPSDLIGQTVPTFELQNPQGKLIDRLFFDNKPTALLWLGGDESVAAAEKFAAAVASLSPDQFNFGLVYSENELADPNASSLAPNEQLKRLADLKNIPLYFDRQLSANSVLRIKSIPTVVVLNGDSKLEFARALSDDDWASDLTAAIQRVARGEDVASEMKIAYQNFLDDYHQQLTEATAIGLPGVTALVSTQSTSDSTDNSNAGLHNGRVTAELIWTNNEFQRPGNCMIQRRSNSETILVFDGWQTIVELDSTGRTLNRHELDLPEQVAVSCLRLATEFELKKSHGEKNSAAYALFNVQGAQAYLYDHDWRPVASLPAFDFQHDGIRDVQFAGSVDAASQQLIVAFEGSRGVYRFELSDRTTQQLAETNANSLAIVQNNYLFCNFESYGVVGEPAKTAAAPTGILFRRLVPAVAVSTPAIFATVADANKRHELVRVGAGGKFEWHQPIGSQLFENEIEPAATLTTSAGTTLIAIADVDRGVSMLNDQGELLGRITFNESLSGIGLIESSGTVQLVLSTTKGVKCFRLSFEP